MSYKTLMAHLELGRSNAGLLTIVKQLAAQFDAGVIGLAAKHPPVMAYGDGSMSSSFVERDREDIDVELKAAEAEFRAALQPTVNALEWRSTTIFTPLADFLAFEARGADLVVTCVASGELDEDSSGVNAGDLIMQVGRPVLIVPAKLATLSVDRVMIAWKDSRESRRATLDALPMLKKAMHVSVVEVVEKVDLKRARRSLDDIVAWLRAHGVNATSLASTADGDVAEHLQDLAQAHKADIVVAGAYGHSRLREWALGGVTRDLLLQSKHCSLVSH